MTDLGGCRVLLLRDSVVPVYLRCGPLMKVAIPSRYTAIAGLKCAFMSLNKSNWIDAPRSNRGGSRLC